PSRRRLAPPQDEDKSVMTLKKVLILRSPRSGHPEGRTTPVRKAVGAIIRSVVGMTIIAMASACTVGPDYQRPAAPVPATYKEAAYRAPAYRGTGRPETLWRVARPADAIDRG